ncbi:MAG: hypothetical protein HZC01_05575 [Candidatus Kerfeldbacteria bacterium]|nr:hypothetical protein [Candidatus Kerfeldbacteria bacterium]
MSETTPQHPHSNIREQFLRAYANLPLGTRDEIVATIDGDPVTWKVAYFEVAQNTPRGKEILEQVEKLHIIKP